MKSVLISIRPKWVEEIASGKKTIEVRKSAPKEVPFKAYIYATRPKNFYKCGAVSTSDELLWLANGKIEMGDGFKFWADGDEYQCLNGRIIGEFICDKVATYPRNYEFGYEISENEFNETALTAEQFVDYGNGGMLYGWHISDLKIYDKPKELSEFRISCNRKNPCGSCCNRFTGKPWDICNNSITRPPQSYMYIEELKE